jgi:CPA2 family monovalent cation:H+ antiporter-2
MEPAIEHATPGFFAELVVLLAASAVIAYIGHRLRVLPIVSFLITGAVVSCYSSLLASSSASRNSPASNASLSWENGSIYASV